MKLISFYSFICNHYNRFKLPILLILFSACGEIFAAGDGLCNKEDICISLMDAAINMMSKTRSLPDSIKPSHSIASYDTAHQTITDIDCSNYSTGNCDIMCLAQEKDSSGLGDSETPVATDAPNLCQDATIDTITRTQSGSTYVFKGNFYWEVLSTGTIAEGYPREISCDWDGLEGNLDASVTLPTGKTYFFKGTDYWSFTNKKMDSGYPKLITEGFKGIPNMLDAALVWSGNGKIYFFKGDKYWRYDSDSDPPVEAFFPLQISEWSPLFADGIDAALQWENNRTYFFKGDQYYRYNDETSDVDTDPLYPLSTAREWFGCR